MGQRFTGTLSRHLQQAQRRKAIDCRFDAVPRQLLLELGQYGILVIFFHHVDEVDDHDTTQIAQPELSCNRLRGFQIRFEYRVVEITRTDKSPRVDVYRGQCFRLVNDQITTRLEIHPPTQRLGNFFINVEEVKYGPLARVELQFL